MLSTTTTLADDTEMSTKGVEKCDSDPLDEARYGPAKDLMFLPIPRHLRYHPDKPFRSSIWINCALAFAAAFCEYFFLPNSPCYDHSSKSSGFKYILLSTSLEWDFDFFQIHMQTSNFINSSNG